MGGTVGAGLVFIDSIRKRIKQGERVSPVVRLLFGNLWRTLILLAVAAFAGSILFVMIYAWSVDLGHQLQIERRVAEEPADR